MLTVTIIVTPQENIHNINGLWRRMGLIILRCKSGKNGVEHYIPLMADTLHIRTVPKRYEEDSFCTHSNIKVIVDAGRAQEPVWHPTYWHRSHK